MITINFHTSVYCETDTSTEEVFKSFTQIKVAVTYQNVEILSKSWIQNSNNIIIASEM